MTESKTYIYGTHALMEALTYAPHTLDEVFAAKHFGDPTLMTLAKKHGIPFHQKMPQGFDDSAAHQGIVGIVSLPRLMRSYDEFCRKLIVGPDTALVLLGELQDPQNVGAVIRSAAAFGISGILIPDHREAQVTGAVVKVSAGMAFKVPLVSIGNINTTLRDLKDRGFMVYGLSGDAKYTVTKEEFVLPTVFVLGNESEGIREKTKELCDKLLSIPMHPRCESLNAATSASVAFYAWSAKHSKALRI